MRIRSVGVYGLAGCLLLLSVGLTGCRLADRLLGACNGYLFQGFDVLSTPDEPVELVARVQKGDWLRDKAGWELVFWQGEAELGRARTDGEGYARLRVLAPPAPGDYAVTVRPAQPPLCQRAGDARLLLVVRSAETPWLVTDLDRTIVRDGYRRVLAGDAQPMPDAARVLHRIAAERGCGILYLTHRPDFLGKLSRDWLDQNGFPPGPLVLNEDLTARSSSSKQARLATLRGRFPRLLIGVGDLPGDAAAYLANGVKLCLVLVGDDLSQRERARRLEELSLLGRQVQVVKDWNDIERVVLGPQGDIDALASPSAPAPRPAHRPAGPDP